MAKGRLAVGDIASLFIAGSFAILAANLTMVITWIDVHQINRMLLMSLWPGLYFAYVLTGGKDASPGQQNIAPYLAAAINASLDFIAILVIRLIWRQLMSDECHKTNHLAKQGDIDEDRGNSASGF